MHARKQLAIGLAVLGLATSACSSDEATAPTTPTVSVSVTEPLATVSATNPPATTPLATEPPVTEPPATDPPSTAPPPNEPADGALDTADLVAALADDALEGRDNLTEGSLASQRLLIDQLATFAQPAYDQEGDGAYLQPFDAGSNVLAVIPGGDLADQYVIIGAHYDHLGACVTNDPADTVCNGATDNAAGVAVAMSAARAIAAEGTPRRTVIIALWDAEEDGLLGAAHYASDPLAPLESTVAYINFDIQGANLLPALANTTVVVGAETGGANLVAAAQAAIAETELEEAMLSLLFGQGRSDHAVLVGAGVPSVFFTDANTGCYHTSQDDLAAVDFAKLEQQLVNGTNLLRDLAATDQLPTMTPDAPIATFEDAESMLAVVQRGMPDMGLLSQDAQASTDQFLADLEAMVAGGPQAFDGDSIATLLAGSIVLVEALTARECQP